MTNNGIAGASLLYESYDDEWRSGYLACVLVLVAPRESTTGSRKATLPAFALTVLRAPHRPGNFRSTCPSHSRFFITKFRINV